MRGCANLSSSPKPSGAHRPPIAILLGAAAVLFGGLLLAAPAGATPIHRVSLDRHAFRVASPRGPSIYTHSFLGLGPLRGPVVASSHAPRGRAVGWHRRHDGGTVAPPVFVPPAPTADDTTGDSTARAVPEASAALLFGAGSLLVTSALRRRKATS